jgi:hypothetical protein
MGMFDEITCGYPLPLPENQGELLGKNWRESRFQTKDFDCLLDDYCIREDGTLWRQAYVWETTHEGRLRRKRGEWRATSEYTGSIRFCDFIYGSKADYWVDWSAVFVSGKLTEIKLLTWEERDNRERLEWAAEMKAREERRERFLETWFGRRVYPGYAWIIHGLFGIPAFRLCSWIGASCHRVGTKIDRLGDKLAPYGDPIRAEQRHRSLSELFDDDDE